MKIKRFLIYLSVCLMFLIVNTEKSFALIGDLSDFGGDSVDVKITGENFSGEADSDEFHIWGNVDIKKGDARLQADDVIFNSKTEVAVATGRVYFTQPGTELSGHKVTVEYEKKKGLWEGNVKLVQTGAPADAKKKTRDAFKDGPVTMYSDTLSFSWAMPERAVAQGKVEAHQKDKHLFGDEAVYVSSPETLTVTGNVLVERDDGSWLKCTRLVMDLNASKFDATGSGNTQVKVNVFYDKKKGGF